MYGDILFNMGEIYMSKFNDAEKMHNTPLARTFFDKTIESYSESARLFNDEARYKLYLFREGTLFQFDGGGG